MRLHKLCCRKRLFLLAGVAPEKVTVPDLKIPATCPMLGTELGGCSVASLFSLVSSPAEVQASCFNFALVIFTVPNSDQNGYKVG